VRPQGAGRQAVVDLVAGLLVHALDHGIDPGIPSLDPLDGLAKHFSRVTARRAISSARPSMS